MGKLIELSEGEVVKEFDQLGCNFTVKYSKYKSFFCAVKI